MDYKKLMLLQICSQLKKIICEAIYNMDDKVYIRG